MKIVVAYSVREKFASFCKSISEAEGVTVWFPEPGYWACVDILREHAPDVILTTDALIASTLLALPDLGSESLPPHKRIVMTDNFSPMLLVVAAQAGFDEVVDMEQPVDVIINQILGVVRGNRSLRSNPIWKLLDYPLDISRAEVIYRDKTDEQIVGLVAAGLSDREIADLVYLSCQTVRNRVSKLLETCGVRNRTQLALLYARSQYARIVRLDTEIATPL